MYKYPGLKQNSMLLQPFFMSSVGDLFIILDDSMLPLTQAMDNCKKNSCRRFNLQQLFFI